MRRDSMTRLRARCRAAALASLVIVVSCRARPRDESGAVSVDNGRALIDANGCGACHAISGMADADGTIGPPLSGLARRSYIAGLLPNTRDNLAAWIRTPQAFKPGVPMPNLGLSANEATDIAAYLDSRY
jgi:cytochrome c2